MLLETGKRSYTLEEYLQIEETAEDRHEYRDGKIVLMTGGTTNHSQIAGNFYFYFRLVLNNQNYKIFGSDVKVWIPRYRQGTYPDVMVIEGEPIYEGNRKTVVTNPALIVEVLSKSTKNYDQGDKFLYYRSIQEFKEYILIEQERYYVMQYTKTSDGKWLLTEYEGEEAVLSLSVVDIQIELKKLYEGVEFLGENE
jgi:Uma2 family endonuclease